MRDDKDLNFLSKIPSEQLSPLVLILTEGKGGKRRLSEALTSHSLYQENHPDHHQYWHLIADEIQRFGANSFVNVVRGKGVPYKEVATDVAKKLKINVEVTDDTEMIELNIMLKIMSDSLSELSPQELQNLVDELGIKTLKLTPDAIITAMTEAIKKSITMRKHIAEIVSEAVTKQMLGKGLNVAASAAITRSLSFLLGPIGWTAVSAWTAADIAGPAYRVTIPAVIQVALLRAQLSEQTTA